MECLSNFRKLFPPDHYLWIAKDRVRFPSEALLLFVEMGIHDLIYCNASTNFCDNVGNWVVEILRYTPFDHWTRKKCRNKNHFLMQQVFYNNRYWFSENLLVEQNGCVKTCSFGYHDNGRGQCIQCKNKICDKGEFSLLIECFFFFSLIKNLCRSSTFFRLKERFFLVNFCFSFTVLFILVQGHCSCIVLRNCLILQSAMAWATIADHWLVTEA